jgi:peptidyl-prolyl cis-trans isomerase SurA
MTLLKSLKYLATLAVCSAALSAQTVVEEIIVRVNESIITKSDLQRSRDQLQQEMKQGKSGDSRDFATKEKDLLRDLIDQKLLISRAKDEGITVENELIKRLDEIRKQNNMESMEDLEKAAREQGVSFEDFKDNMRNSMLTQKVISQDVGRRINISPSEVTKYYQEHKAEFKAPEQVRLGEILISTEAKPDAKPAVAAMDPAAAEAKAKSLLEQLKGGAKFGMMRVRRKAATLATSRRASFLPNWKRSSLRCSPARSLSRSRRSRDTSC